MFFMSELSVLNASLLERFPIISRDALDTPSLLTKFEVSLRFLVLLYFISNFFSIVL